MTKEAYPVSEQVAAHAHITADQYREMYDRSIRENDLFWDEQAKKFITWFRKWDTTRIGDFQQLSDGGPPLRWFDGGQLNACYNCVDRHVENGRGDRTAIIWESDDPDYDRKYTYAQVLEKVSKFANVLKLRGVQKGDRVSIYMPMIAEAAFAMLACARIGAVHSVVFGGFSPEALKDRILDSDCRVVITADEGLRGGKTVPLKNNVDQALADCPNVHTVIVAECTGEHVSMVEGRDIYLSVAMELASPICPPEVMDAEDPLFILYTSGSTGKPKGVLHTTGGYMVYAAMTHKYVFDYHDDDIYWCTADVGWVTGHSYILYGPMANGATTLMFEGVPNYPDGGRFWDVVDKHKVTLFYTAPTAIRAIMALGDDFVTRADRSTLRLLGTVGEPINPEVWEWYRNVVGGGDIPVVDTWWQTETGGILITPLPGATELKPGSATKPFFGVEPALVDTDGNEMELPNSGNLVLKRPWPGQMRTVYGDHERFIQTYFTTYPGLYFTGDGARCDEDGYWWVTGRVDDVINVSGHRMGTAEVESAIVLHPQISEAAVVGYPHDIKGWGIYAYVTPMVGVEPTEELRKEIVALVRKEIGPIASPDLIQWAPGLPKTRSGKIMRRILRKVAYNEIDQLGDTSTLADPKVVDNIIANRLNK